MSPNAATVAGAFADFTGSPIRRATETIGRSAGDDRLIAHIERQTKRQFASWHTQSKPKQQANY
jgi:hypothetical protein